MQLKEDLIKRCLKKDPSAQKELYFAYAKFVYGLCRRYTTDDHQAKDYVQESFHKIFLYLDRFDVRKGAFKAWISTITINTIPHPYKHLLNNSFGYATFNHILVKPL